MAAQNLPDWREVRESLTKAIQAALPYQLEKASGERIAGVGVHMDAFYGSAGLYLLTESAARSLDSDSVNNIGDWPISTDWDGSAEDAQAFAKHWERWDDWFHEHTDDPDDSTLDEKARGLLRTACEAMRNVEESGLLAAFPKTKEFMIVIAEHDEPDELALERYGMFIRTGAIRCHGDPE